MHPILSLDTAPRSATVTLGTSDAYAIVHSDPEARNSRDLMQLIAGILAPSGGLAQTQLEAVALNRGPGSYTGARVGASVIQGIAYAKGLPVVLLTTFELLLLRAESLGLLSAERDVKTIILVVESKVGEYFWVKYESDHGFDSDRGLLLEPPSQLSPLSVDTGERLLELHQTPQTLIIGNDAIREHPLGCQLGRACFVTPAIELAYPLIEARLARGEVVDALSVDPLYGQETIGWKTLAEQRQ